MEVDLRRGPVGFALLVMMVAGAQGCAVGVVDLYERVIIAEDDDPPPDDTALPDDDTGGGRIVDTNAPSAEQCQDGVEALCTCAEYQLGPAYACVPAQRKQFNNECLAQIGNGPVISCYADYAKTIAQQVANNPRRVPPICPVAELDCFYGQQP